MGLEGARVKLDGSTCLASLWTRGWGTPRSLQELNRMQGEDLFSLKVPGE